MVVTTEKRILNKLITEYKWSLPNYEAKKDVAYDDDFVAVSVYCNAYRATRSPAGTMEYPRRCGNPIFTTRIIKSQNYYISMFMTCSGCVAKYKVSAFWNAEKQVLEPGPTILKGVKTRNIEVFERNREVIEKW
jgi:hypothetical protein